MKAVKVVLIGIALLALIGWAREGSSFSIFECLPLLSGPGKPLVYQLGGIAMLALAAMGLARLARGGDTSDADDVEYEPAESDADEDREDDEE